MRWRSLDRGGGTWHSNSGFAYGSAHSSLIAQIHPLHFFASLHRDLSGSCAGTGKSCVASAHPRRTSAPQASYSRSASRGRPASRIVVPEDRTFRAPAAEWSICCVYNTVPAASLFRIVEGIAFRRSRPLSKFRSDCAGSGKTVSGRRGSNAPRALAPPVPLVSTWNSTAAHRLLPGRKSTMLRRSPKRIYRRILRQA
jgi:hypothetical protein